MLKALACVAVAAASLLMLPGAPGYDAWAWLTWGREVGRLELDTVDGPAWKPLPVAATALLAPLGDAAPLLWVLAVRASAVAAVLLAFACARRLGGSAAGALAAAALVLTGGFVRHAAVGDSEPLLIALALGALRIGLDGHHRAALALAALCGLLRPEVWPFLALYGLWRWREDAGLRPALVAVAVAVPALWFVPEWLGSGELLRSSDRARIPNPGQPATAERPALETLAGAAAVVFVPVAALAVLARGPGALVAVAGAAWIALVALMSEAGFSGEGRYLLPGAALLAVAGGAGAVRTARALANGVGIARPLGAALLGVAASAALGVAAVRAGDVVDLRPRLQHQARLASGLDRAVALAGGRDAVLACGRPAVGRYRGTLLAWHLDVPKRTVRADGAPGGATFRSRLTAGSRPSPGAVPAARTLVHGGPWHVTCAG